MNTHYDDPHADLLARALKSEADTVLPAGDGLTRIRARIERRRTRLRWLMPMASLATAGALGAAAFGAYTALSDTDTLHSQDGGVAHQPSGTNSPAPTTPGPSGSTSPGGSLPVGGTEPSPALWPFSSSVEVQQWQSSYASGGHSPWHLDAKMTAIAFVDSLGLPHQNVVVTSSTTANGSADLVLATTTTANGQSKEFATMHLVKWGTGRTAPWEVTAVQQPDLQISAPTSATSVQSPLDVHYTLNGGVEEDVYLSVWDGSARLASAHKVTGGGAHVSKLVFGRPSTATGYVVVADVQGLSGTSTLGRLTVAPIRFASGTTTVANHYPPFFVAVKDQRLALFYSTLGGFARWLTDSQPGGGVSSPQITSDGKWVYFLRGNGTSSQTLMRISILGGQEQPVVTDTQALITAFAIGDEPNPSLAYVVTSGSGQDLVWSTADGVAGTMHHDGVPPMIEQLAWSSDGRHLTAQIRTGTAWEMRTYDVTTASALSDGRLVPGGSVEAPSYDAAGNLYYIRTTSDTQHWELVQYDGRVVRHVSFITLPTATNPETATVDITPDAYAAVVSTSNGVIYRVNEGAAHLLATTADAATW